MKFYERNSHKGNDKKKLIDRISQLWLSTYLSETKNAIDSRKHNANHSINDSEQPEVFSAKTDVKNGYFFYVLKN